LRVIRITADEMVFVETLELIVADTASHGRNVVHVRCVNHCCHGRINVAGLKFIPAVGFPEGNEVAVRHVVPC